MEQDAFDATADDRYLEDYVPGAVYEWGEVSVDQEQILQFAKEYDPQFFHVDPEAAADGPYGGLIASGWQTAGLMMRLLAEHYLTDTSSLGGPGVDELRWLRPVRPGDVLRLRVTVLEARPSASRPDRGLLRTRAELLDDAGEPVFRCTVLNLVRRRPS